jgi:eukaryotic-like serine/threonine-protein kinase
MAQAIERTVPAGTRLGRYEVITHLASGGMASVFLARALGAAGFHRLVAIKLLHPHVAADEQFIAMFLDEARLAARIHHPNVVPTLDLQDGTDGHYLVMEFVEGESLLGLLRQGAKLQKPVAAPVAVRVMLDALAGLHAAHELRGDLGEPLNLVHRDVSPHNILVGVDGVARIVDFGIARAEERLGTTRDGQVKGKLAYLAPEQAQEEIADRRVDVFTAGIVLWECLAQRRLFRGQTDAEVLRKLLDKPIPSLTEINPSFPKAIADVLARALERDKEKRFATAAEFAEALETAATPLGIATSKQVSAYVRLVAGESIEGLMRRARAFLEGTKIPSTPPPPKVDGSAARGTSQTPSVDNPNSAVRSSSTPMNLSVPSTDPKPVLSVEVEPDDVPFRSRKPLLIAGVAAVFAIVGVTTFVVVSRTGSPAREAQVSEAVQPAQHKAEQTSEPIAAHPFLTPPPVPAVTADVAAASTTAVFDGHGRTGTRKPSASASGVVPATPQSAATAAPVLRDSVPPPVSSAFNPEAM